MVVWRAIASEYQIYSPNMVPETFASPGCCCLFLGESSIWWSKSLWYLSGVLELGRKYGVFLQLSVPTSWIPQTQIQHHTQVHYMYLSAPSSQDMPKQVMIMTLDDDMNIMHVFPKTTGHPVCLAHYGGYTCVHCPFPWAHGLRKMTPPPGIGIFWCMF